MSFLRYGACAAALGLLLAGCGDSGADKKAADSSEHACLASATRMVQADLDGDGTQEQIAFGGANGHCPATLTGSVGGKGISATVGSDPTLGADALEAITIPGRTGQLVLLRLSHPRGGFQARLFGYADRKFAELTSAGKPIFSFVATDAPAEHVSASCTHGGFTVTEAVTHQPMGVAAAWDVFRTSYTIQGNQVTAGNRTQVAQNVLDDQLAGKYPAVAADRLFGNC